MGGVEEDVVGGGKVGAGDKKGRRGGKGGENRCEKEAQKGGGSRGKEVEAGGRRWEQGEEEVEV